MLLRSLIGSHGPTTLLIGRQFEFTAKTNITFLYLYYCDYNYATQLL